MAEGFDRDEVVCSFDTARLDIALIHRFLSTEACWSLGSPRATVERSIAHSLRIGAYRGDEQVGFARPMTDRATFACLGDVFVVARERRQGTAARLMRALLARDAVQGLRRVLLFTAVAHRLYEGLGFGAPARPERAMEIAPPDVDAQTASA